MSEDGTIYDWIAMQQQVMPEWVGGAGRNAHYAAPDIGSQASQLNFTQDLMGTGVDPLMLWLAGEMDSGSLASQFEEDEVIPGDTRGRDFLTNVLNTTSPDSIENLIAEHILAGGSPIEAVKLAEQSGLIKPSMRDAYHQGQKVGQEPDTSERDYYLKWATDAQTRLLQDKEEQRNPGKEILHPFVQRMLDAGFTDPRQQYTPNYVNPAVEGMERQVQGGQAQTDVARAKYGAMRDRVRDPRMVDEARNQLGILGQALKGGQSQEPQYEPLLDTNGQRPFSLDLGGGGFNNAFDMQPQIMRKVEPAKAQAMPKSKPYDPTADKQRADTAFQQYRETSTATAAAKKAMVQERAKAKAVSNYLQGQGRTPALDQYQAAMQALMARGIGR